MDVRLQTDVNALFGKILVRYVDAMEQTLRFVGERFVVDVRGKLVANPAYREAMRAIMARPKVSITQATPRYADDTGNLTASVGFLILKNGQVVSQAFNGPGEGQATGELAAREVAARFPTGLVLIVVAGMQYAAAVESMGYDVLTGSSFIAEKELREALKGIQA